MAEPLTRQIRVPADLAEKLAWVADIEGTTVGEVVDDLIRKPVERRYDRVSAEVETIKAARAKHQHAKAGA